MADLRRVVLDVLKPHEPPLLEFTERLSEVDGIDASSTSLIELDQEVQNIKVTVEGRALDYAEIERAIDDLGGTIHSVDQAAYGEYIVEERRTPQDN